MHGRGVKICTTAVHCATMTFYAPAFLTTDHNDDENGESENGDDNQGG